MINIVCALHCEAKPIVDFYQLSALPGSHYPIYSNDKINLLITGIGKINTAAAMAYFFVKMTEPKNSAWLNYGIAGHKTADLGSWFNVNKMTDVASGVNWYPARLQEKGQLTSALFTVDTPESNYVGNLLYDMEASAFMAIALKFSSSELIQSLKIVSDNETHQVQGINKKQVQQLLFNNIAPIVSMVETLGEQQCIIENIYGIDSFYTELIKKWHFTEYQRKELERLIQRCRLLGLMDELHFLDKCKNAKQVVAGLKDNLKKSKVEF